MVAHRYLLKKDAQDSRDFIYLRKQKSLPEKVDLREKCSQVEDQGKIGSCTANALVGALEFLEKKATSGFVDLSRLFIYFNERLSLHQEKQDSGARLRDGIKALKKYGVCAEETWPYQENLLLERPSDKAYTEALNHCISKYERIKSLDAMKDALASGFPFVFGVQVYSSFESEDVAKTGVVPFPSRGDTLLGGHALLAVGYDDSKEVFIFRNSWGAQWGDQGYGTLPYDYFKSELAQDFWAIQK